MKRMWTIISAWPRKRPRSFKWYQSLDRLPEAAPAHDDFGQIIDSDPIIDVINDGSEKEHPSLTSPHYA